MYLEHLPRTPALRPFVECFWTRTASASATGATFSILPDGCLDVLIEDGAEAGAWVIGAMSRPLVVADDGSTAFHLGARFRPGQAARFFGVPAHELTDGKAALGDVESGGKSLADALLSEASLAARLGRLEDYLLARLPLAMASGDPYVDAVARRILVANGGVSMDELSAFAGVTRQHLARRFRAHVGLTPKAFARIARFRAVMAAWDAGGLGAWADAAAALGYSDQAHLCRDFKEFAGASPAQWAAGK